MKKLRLSFAKQKRSRGIFRLGQRFVLNYGGNVVAHVAPINLQAGGYYWYGLGRNTAGSPSATVEEAKKECMDFVKTKLDELREKFKKFDAAE